MSEEDVLTLKFSEQCGEARRTLLAHMMARGLHETDGWRISETTRFRNGKAELVMRPIHRVLASPDDLECVVAIDVPNLQVRTECDA